MGIIEQQLSKKKKYYQSLDAIVRSKPPFKIRISFIVMHYYKKLSGVDYNTDGFSILFNVVEKITKLLDLIEDNNPKYINRKTINESILGKYTPQWSAKELYEILKRLKHFDGRTLLSRFASTIGHPTLIDTFDSNAPDSFIEEFKHIESEDVRKFMSLVNILYRAQDYKDALDENNKNLDSFINEEGDLEDYEMIHEEVMLPLLEQSGFALLFGKNPYWEIYFNYGEYIRNFRNGGELIPTGKVLEALEYVLQDYYYNKNIFKPKEDNAVQMVLNQEKYKELVKPIVEKCKIEFEQEKQKDNGAGPIEEGEKEIQVIDARLQSSKATRMFELFMEKGYITGKMGEKYNWVKEKYLLAYFVKKASEYLTMSYTDDIAWKYFPAILLWQDESVTAKDLNSTFNNNKGKHKNIYIDSLFEQLSKEK